MALSGEERSNVRNIFGKARRASRLSGKYAGYAGRMVRGPGPKYRDFFKKESANASPERFQAFQRALANARQTIQDLQNQNKEIQDLQNQNSSTATTPVKEEVIERKIKGYLGERPVYEDEEIRFTDGNWEII